MWCSQDSRTSVFMSFFSFFLKHVCVVECAYILYAIPIFLGGGGGDLCFFGGGGFCLPSYLWSPLAGSAATDFSSNCNKRLALDSNLGHCVLESASSLALLSSTAS